MMMAGPAHVDHQTVASASVSSSSWRTPPLCGPPPKLRPRTRATTRPPAPSGRLSWPSAGSEVRPRRLRRQHPRLLLHRQLGCPTARPICASFHKPVLRQPGRAPIVRLSSPLPRKIDMVVLGRC